MCIPREGDVDVQRETEWGGHWAVSGCFASKENIGGAASCAYQGREM